MINMINMINKQRTIDEFVKLVSIDSPSFGEREMADYLKASLVELGFEVTEDDFGKYNNGSAGNVYGYLEGQIEGSPILFCAHMDTVEPAKGKRAIVHENGKITSAGDTVLGSDDCAGICAILEALRVVKEQNLPHRSIEILFTAAEEAYCIGSEYFDGSIIKAKDAYVLDLSGEIGTAAYKAPTAISFTAHFIGKAAHAGFEPEKGVHAIHAAAKAVSELKLGHLENGAKLNIGVIEGGRATNIVPDSCIVKGEVRSFSHELALDQVKLVEHSFSAAAKSIGAVVEFTSHIGCIAYETGLDEIVVKRFEHACSELGLNTSFIETFGGSDNNHLVRHGIQGLVVSVAMTNCHSLEEFTTVEQLQSIANLTALLMTSKK